MIDVFYKEDNLVISNSDKKTILFNTNNLEVLIDNFPVNYPWEYEKSWILVETKEYQDKLFYNLLMEWKHIILITSDSFEIKEEILSFFGDVDLLVIVWSKEAAKIYESIEAKYVLAYWEWKDLFLNTLWQNIEEVNNFKLKSDSLDDITNYINLIKE